MEEHPIEGVLSITMDRVREMIDVNTIIGEKIIIGDNISIIPVSKVSLGFASGGSDFAAETLEDYKKMPDEEKISYKNPFAGGSGAGISIKPVAFLVVENETAKLLPVEHNCTLDRLLDYIPEAMNEFKNIFGKFCKKDEDF